MENHQPQNAARLRSKRHPNPEFSGTLRHRVGHHAIQPKRCQHQSQHGKQSDQKRAEPGLRNRPVQLARRFTTRLGLPRAESPIVPIIVGATDAALAASRALLAEGFLVVAIRPPTVPAGTARLRIAFSAAHTDAMVDALADSVARLGVVG